MSELNWNWVYRPYLDAPDKQKESALKAGYAKVCFKSEVDAAIAELKAKLEDVQASHYSEMVDAGMRERRLRRALWMHRAITAKFNNEACKAMREYNPFIGIEEYKWQEVERKCRAKAEGYR